MTEKYLAGNAYPGRGIILGKSEDGKHSVALYFIMGRSENSRNRIFVADGDGFRTQAHDPLKMTDPSLIIYWPVRMYGDQLIITNGDQTDTVYDFLSRNGTFEDALRTRTFEPDSPNFTPRISGFLRGTSMKLSILKSDHGDPRRVRRFFYEYEDVTPGSGYLIHTYAGDGDPLPSFSGEPVGLTLPGSISACAQRMWNSLDADNRVSLLCIFTHLETGERQSLIINKHGLED